MVFYSQALLASLFDYTIHFETQEAQNFKDLRKSAIDQNRQLALNLVIDKLVPIKYFDTVKKLLSGDKSYFFEGRVEVKNEQILETQYSIDISYYFNQSKIIKFLTDNDIPYVTHMKNKILFIPTSKTKVISSYTNQTMKVKLDKNIIKKFANKTNWFKLWKSIRPKSFLTQVVLPINIADININKIKSKQLSYINSLKKEYKVDSVILADLLIKFKQKAIDSSISNESEGVDKIIKENTIDTKSDLTKQEDPAWEIQYNLNLIDSNSESSAHINDLQTMNKAIAYVIGLSEDLKKNNLIAKFKDKHTKIFTVSYNSFVDFITIYSVIQSLEQVENIYMKEIYAGSVKLSIKYHGNIEAIVKKVKQRNITFDVPDKIIKCDKYCY